MQIHVEWLAGEVVVEHDLAAHKGLEGQCCEHVQAKAQPCNIDHGVVGWEVVEHIALCLVAKGEKPSQRQRQTGHHGDTSRVVRDFGEPVDRRFFERAVDEEGVVMANKRCSQLAIPLAGYKETTSIPKEITPIA